MQKRIISELKFSWPKRSLLIKKDVLEVFYNYEQKTNEKGGILLGYAFKEHDEIVKITIPNKLDSAGMFFFNRARKPAQAQITKSWKESKGCLIYLGEWHTHSLVNPKPSRDDKNMIKKTFRETKMEIDRLYLIIVGQNNTYWVGRQSNGGLIRGKPSFIAVGDT